MDKWTVQRLGPLITRAPSMEYKRKRSKIHRMVNRYKIIPLSYVSQITTTFGLSPYELAFNQKPQKSKLFTAKSSKMNKVIVNLLKIEFVTTYLFTVTMKIIFIIQKF